MRCFVAVELDEALRLKIAELQQQIRNYDVKLVEENNLHFTLKFLGEVTDSTLTKVKNALAEVSGSTAAFEITLKGTILYPTEKYIRVIYIDTADEGLLNLHNAINTALAGLFKKEKVRPHLTLARTRSSRDNAKLAEFASHYKEAEIGKMFVDKFALKKSTLTPKGPVYEDLAVFSLAG